MASAEDGCVRLAMQGAPAGRAAFILSAPPPAAEMYVNEYIYRVSLGVLKARLVSPLPSECDTVRHKHCVSDYANKVDDAKKAAFGRGLEG